ncbi:hypothetical protein PsorP6_010124 [Peronosclerospora sorghi]|uniref:Uncharacterized protein n=1 Tax=Peronosclerospora sorghi TaxID=230839 RepID=A0ACC0VZ94_9STRA|nr:hypothetical protein PsorP6_010124 [Peronosclerospora sorghi]
MILDALEQSTGKSQMQSLYSGDFLPLADFQLYQPLNNVLPEQVAPDFERSFKVSVSTPLIVGSGYSLYTQYVIFTKVTDFVISIGFKCILMCLLWNADELFALSAYACTSEASIQ